VMNNLKHGTFFPAGENEWMAFRLTIELATPKRSMLIESSLDLGNTWRKIYLVEYSK
jgi:hypothetical protein